jgi:hypothetical protein
VKKQILFTFSHLIFLNLMTKIKQTYMRKLIVVFFSFLLISTVRSQTVDEVLGKFENAIGGRAALDTIKTLQITGTLKFDMMGRTVNAGLDVIRDKGKFFRRQVTGGMGMGKSYTIITDTEGFVAIPRMRGPGGYGGGEMGGRGGDGTSFTPPVITRDMGGDRRENNSDNTVKLNASQVAEQHFELDPAGPFAPLINYAAKGNKAELAGTAKVNKVECYKIKFTFKSGQQITYYISTKDYLIVQSETIAKFAVSQVGIGPVLSSMGANSRDNMKTVMTYSNYKDFNGIKFPGIQKLEFGALDIEVENTDVKINQPIDAKWLTAD